MLGLGNSLTTGGVLGLVPSEISGLELHLKVNTGIVGADGGASADGDMADGEDINSWADQSGRARHASQSSELKKPHWETDAADFGGLVWTEADADPHLNLAQYSSADLVIDANEDFTIMIRFSISDFTETSSSTLEARALIGSTAQNVIKLIGPTEVKTLIGGSGALGWADSASMVVNTYYILTLTRSDGSTGNLEVRIHGGAFSDKSWDSAESHRDADAFTINNIGCANDGVIPMEGVIKDVLVWKGTALTTSQRGDMHSYINGQEY